jgi:predicted deacylase
MRICASLGMVDNSGVDEVPEIELWLHGSGNTDTFAGAPRKGYFAADTTLLAPVTQGDLVGRVFDSRGRIIAPVYAPATGFVTFLRREAAVDAGTPLMSVSQARPARLFPS